MTTKNVNIKIDEMKTNTGLIKNLELSIGKVVNDNWTEPMGPTPMPSMSTLRDWDMKLLARYKPFYMPDCDLCCLCTFGKCDLTAGKRGACGIDIGCPILSYSTFSMLHWSCNPHRTLTPHDSSLN